MGAREASVLKFQLRQPINLYRHHGNAKLRGQQAAAGHERVHASVFASGSFRKDQNTLASVHHLARVGEAATKAALLRQGEDVEEGHDQYVLRPLFEAHEPTLITLRANPVAQYFSLHGYRQMTAEPVGQRLYYQRVVNHRDVVRDEEHGRA